ncbi:MAG TPA: amidase, partial [Actinomycetota bacterium]|nr:amidase [Actinomycetota bacterium]
MLRDLARAVRSRRASARELVHEALRRIERLDPGIGAVVALRAEEALAEARELDERVARGEDPGPLSGVPFLVKDIEDLAGLPTTHGSALFAGARPAERDGRIPRQLRAAGAIPVGKANTPEFACEGFTANLLFGATRNPWAPAFSPGGSSGGSGAAIAAGMVPAATATDTGGSIRIPAAFCGLVGLKPTNGLVGLDPSLAWPDLTTCGPLAATVDDARLLLDAMAGPEPGDRL